SRRGWQEPVFGPFGCARARAANKTAPESRLVNMGIAARKGRQRGQALPDARLHIEADEVEIFHHDGAALAGLLLAGVAALLAHQGKLAARPPEGATARLRDGEHLFRRRVEITLDHRARA